MLMVMFLLGIALFGWFYLLPRRHRSAVTSTDPGGRYTDHGGYIDVGSNGGADCSSPSDAGCSDGGGGGGDGGGGD
jgi:hypothetical protein